MKNGTRNRGTDLKRACKGCLVSLIVTLLLALLFGKLIDGGLLGMQLLPAAGCAVTGLSALAGCIVTALHVQKRTLVYAFVTSFLYFLLLVFVNGLLLKGEFHSLLPTLLCVAAAALLGSLIGAARHGRIPR